MCITQILIPATYSRCRRFPRPPDRLLAGCSAFITLNEPPSIVDEGSLVFPSIPYPRV